MIYIVSVIRANREKERQKVQQPFISFFISATTEANEILNADAQAAEQPELHIANVNIPILIDSVETTSATSSKVPTEVTEQLQQVEEQAEQQLLHDYLHEDYQLQGYINDNQDSTNTIQVDLLNVEMSVFKDPGLWPEIITDKFRTELIVRGSEALQNKDGPFATRNTLSRRR